MNGGIIYLKPKQRMPVSLRPVIYLRDIQQDIPAAWCIGCKQELFSGSLCRRCKGGCKNEKE